MSTSIDGTAVQAATRALVLGGGGPVGRAWESGLAAGWLLQRIDLDGADLIIGTSAGAIVGAEIALGLSMDALGPVADSPGGPAPAQISPAGLQRMMAATARAATSPQPDLELREIGQMALAALTCGEEESLSRITFAPISGRKWAPNFLATSVSTRTGRFQVWTAASGVPLERAVAASSALPNVWPPITIGQDRYMDGGMRSTLNADLAAGYSQVVVVSCFALGAARAADAPAAPPDRSPRGEIESLRAGGSAVEVVTPGTAFLALTGNGTRMLDSSLVPEAYEAGRRQALDDGPRIRANWNRGGRARHGVR
jgi:NTE family protein